MIRLTQAHRRVASSMERATAAMNKLGVQLAPLGHLVNCPVCAHVPDRFHAYCYDGNLLHRRALGEDV